MEMSIEFGSREILNTHLDLEEKLIVEIFQLSMNQVLLTDISDVYSLQDLDIIQENLKTVFNLEISQDELEKLTVGQLVLRLNSRKPSNGLHMRRNCKILAANFDWLNWGGKFSSI